MSTVKVVTLGLFILDTFEWRDASGTVATRKSEVIIGGGGTYAILGSRMWLSQDQLGILVDRGHDWPSDLQEQIERYGEDMWVYRNKPGPTTRALNLYTGEHRDFKYLTERIRLEPKDLPPAMRSAKVLHFVCSPTRANEIQSQLEPANNATTSWQPDLCYEPIPDRCIPEELEALERVLPHVKVFSPNHEEAAAFFGINVDAMKRDGKTGVEQVAKRFFDLGAKDMVVIRSGAWGAYAIRRGQEHGTWVPAYHTNVARVKDVTGAGNSFLGGLMAGLTRDSEDLVTAVQMGSISASFTIEQFGLPVLSTTDSGVERWNGLNPEDRLREMRDRANQP